MHRKIITVVSTHTQKPQGLVVTAYNVCLKQSDKTEIVVSELKKWKYGKLIGKCRNVVPCILSDRNRTVALRWARGNIKFVRLKKYYREIQPNVSIFKHSRKPICLPIEM